MFRSATIAAALALSLASESAIAASVALPNPTPESVVSQAEQDALRSAIIRGKTVDAAAAAVERVGATVQHRLNIIRSVSAELTASQLDALRRDAAVIRVTVDRGVTVAGPTLDTHYPTLVDAHSLHTQGITGQGLTVAVPEALKDTGLWNKTPLIHGGDRSLSRPRAI